MTKTHPVEVPRASGTLFLAPLWKELAKKFGHSSSLPHWNCLNPAQAHVRARKPRFARRKHEHPLSEILVKADRVVPRFPPAWESSSQLSTPNRKSCRLG